MDDGPDPDSDREVGPDLANDALDLLPPHRDAVIPRQIDRRFNSLTTQLRLEHERLNPAFKNQTPKHISGEDGDDEAEHDVDGSDFPAEQSEDQDHGHFVRHW